MLYVIIGVAVSFFIAWWCEDKDKERSIIFRRAFIFEFVFVFVSGGGLLIYQKGYFSDKEPSIEGAILVFACSIIMASAIGFKAAFPHIR